MVMFHPYSRSDYSQISFGDQILEGTADESGPNCFTVLFLAMLGIGRDLYSPSSCKRGISYNYIEFHITSRYEIIQDNIRLLSKEGVETRDMFRIDLYHPQHMGYNMVLSLYRITDYLLKRRKEAPIESKHKVTASTTRIKPT